MSFFEIYNPKNKIIEMINNSDGFAPDHILNLMKMTRELMEEQNIKDKYPMLNLYCNWCLHIELNGSNTIFDLLNKISKILIKKENILEEFIKEISQILSMEELRQQIIELYKSNNIPTFWFTILENWQAFRSRLLINIVNKPIGFPPDIEDYCNNIKIQDRNKKAVRVYKEMKNNAQGLRVTTLYLTDTLEGEQKGDVYWVIETIPQRYIVGRLNFYDIKSAR